MKHIVIGTRGSQLALAQTEIVKNLLLKQDPHLHIDINIITTTGDKNMKPIPLDSIGKGWFTKEIDKALLDGHIDLAVHSLKDLPEKLPPGLIIAAIPEREDAREAMVSKENISFDQLPKGAVIGTDSTRRSAQILHQRPNLVVTSLRGNVNSRLEKLKTQNYDAIFLAVAGLKRLGLEKEITQYFERDNIIPAPGQGALAIVTDENNKEITRVLEKLNHHPSRIAVTAERMFSNTVGGGCKLPVGAYAAVSADTITIHGFIGSIDGKHLVKDTLNGVTSEYKELAKLLAKQLLRKSKSWYTNPNGNT